MPINWKLAAGGASAQQRADRLRSRADKLARQATAWETGAEREPAVARRLADLPAGFTVLQDLTLPDAHVRLDHLVISAGGLYLVDAKKYSGRLVYSKKMLWHGRFPIIDKLETLVWEAESLSEVIGADVVPVMCFVDAVLPQPVMTLGSVIVCRTSVLHTVVRSTHATMSTADVARVIDIARQLAPQRRIGFDGSDPMLRPLEDPTDHLDVVSGAIDAAPPDVDPSGSISNVPAITTIPPIGGPEQFDGPQREPQARRWPRRLAFACIALVGLAAAVSIVWAVSRSTEKSALEASKNPSVTTVVTVPETTEVTTTTEVDITAAMFSSECPRVGAGWSLHPVWPGDLDGLVWYDFSYRDFDLSWKQFALMSAPDVSNYTPTAVPAGNSRLVQITPVFYGGVVGEARTVTWTAPDSSC